MAPLGIVFLIDYECKAVGVAAGVDVVVVVVDGVGVGVVSGAAVALLCWFSVSAAFQPRLALALASSLDGSVFAVFVTLFG